MAIRYVDIEPEDGKAKPAKAQPKPASPAPPAAAAPVSGEAPAVAAARSKRRKK